MDSHPGSYDLQEHTRILEASADTEHCLPGLSAYHVPGTNDPGEPRIHSEPPKLGAGGSHHHGDLKAGGAWRAFQGPERGVGVPCMKAATEGGVPCDCSGECIWLFGFVLSSQQDAKIRKASP